MNLEELGRLAGVSRSTVSRVVNGDARVSPDARTRVEAAIRESGYVPHAAARSLASNRTRILGLLIPGAVGFIFSDPYFPKLVQGVVDACNAADYGMMLMMEPADDPIAAERIYHRVIRGRHLDGVIVTTSLMGDRLLERLASDELPAVLIGRHPSLPSLTTVDVDNRGAARRAVEHLLGHGHRRIAHLSGPLDIMAAIDRADGYRDALAGGGIPLDDSLLIEGDFTEAKGRDAMRRLLTHPDGRPDAVFCGSDTMAAGALRAIADLGLSAPRDIAVMGFDGLEQHAVSFPHLSTVVQPIPELGRSAVGALLGRISAPEEPAAQMVLPTRLALRGSCGCLDESDELSPWVVRVGRDGHKRSDPDRAPAPAQVMACLEAAAG